MENNLAVSYKTKHILPDVSAVAVIGIYPKKMKSIPTKMSIAVLLITDKSLEATKISFHRWKVK